MTRRLKELPVSDYVEQCLQKAGRETALRNAQRHRGNVAPDLFLHEAQQLLKKRLLIGEHFLLRGRQIEPGAAVDFGKVLGLS